MKTSILCLHDMLSVGDGWVVENGLGRHPGIIYVEANYVNCTATVCYDEAVISLAHIIELLERCGYHCPGESVPGKVPGAGLAHENVPVDRPRQVRRAGS